MLHDDHNRSLQAYATFYVFKFISKPCRILRTSREICFGITPGLDNNYPMQTSKTRKILLIIASEELRNIQTFLESFFFDEHSIVLRGSKQAKLQDMDI